MKSIKSKILVSMLSVVLIGSILIGTITALLNAGGIDALMEKTLGPATQIAADAVRWRMDNYWTALSEAAASEVFRESEPTDPNLRRHRGPQRIPLCRKDGCERFRLHWHQLWRRGLFPGVQDIHAALYFQYHERWPADDLSA